MTAVVQLVSTAHRGYVVIALNRSITESAINLRFLLLKNEERWYEQFARSSLGPERELYDMIQANIKDRDGEILPIERMLDSIDHVSRLTGVKIEEVNPNAGDWGGGLRERLKALGDDKLYIILRTGSHAVHGTWVDLVTNHLKGKTEDMFPILDGLPLMLA